VFTLTERQQQCLEGYLARKTAKQIGRELGITHHAVEQHLKAARRKLGVTDTAEAARLYGQANTTVQPYYAAPELPDPASTPLQEGHPERSIASLRDVASEDHGKVYAFGPGQVLAAIGLCSVGLIIILALLVAIA
jgi:DNA-binding CsgD family transcriptional regulator